MNAVNLSEGIAMLRGCLDALEAPVTLFFRDDDAGWADPQLWRLMDLFEAHALPLDLAAIPAALEPATAEALRRRIHRAPHLFDIHQHGYAHVNHEPAGRKCEFGAARDPRRQAADIAAGRARLAELFSERTTPIFTPPWNRCVPATCRVLADLGFRAISTIRSSAAPGTQPLQGLPVTLDWTRMLRQAHGTGTPVEESLGKALRAPAPVGIMLHHADLHAPDYPLLAACLALLQEHPNVRARQMGQLLNPN
ncbi:MAG: hypothetical protein AB7Q01_15130 [Gammaproteobacteria bacterium]